MKSIGTMVINEKTKRYTQKIGHITFSKEPNIKVSVVGLEYVRISFSFVDFYYHLHQIYVGKFFSSTPFFILVWQILFPFVCLLTHCVLNFWKYTTSIFGLVGRKVWGPPIKQFFFVLILEPNAQPTLCNPFMMSHENMTRQIKHDIGLGLLVKEQNKVVMIEQ
jgi:hypothetical protein